MYRFVARGRRKACERVMHGKEIREDFPVGKVEEVAVFFEGMVM